MDPAGQPFAERQNGVAENADRRTSRPNEHEQDPPQKRQRGDAEETGKHLEEVDGTVRGRSEERSRGPGAGPQCNDNGDPETGRGRRPQAAQRRLEGRRERQRSRPRNDLPLQIAARRSPEGIRLRLIENRAPSFLVHADGLGEERAVHG